MGGSYDGRKYWTMPGGRVYIHSPDYDSQFRYDISWDWFMPVWKKLSQIKPKKYPTTFNILKSGISNAILSNDTPAEAAKLLAEAITWLNTIKNENK